MRVLVLALCAGCSRDALGEHWTRRTVCDRHDGVTARIVSIDHRRLARQSYRIGRFVGMSEPLDEELVVEICNGSEEPIQLSEHAAWLWKADGSCEAVAGPRLAPDEGLRFNRWRPIELAKYPPTIEIGWRHDRNRCGHVYAQ
jgi:hypothetical protein